MLGKPFFMLYHLSLYKDINIGEWFKVMWHGLPMDFSMSAYLMMIPLLLRALSVWINGDWFKVVYTIYLLIITFCISTIFVVDLELYSYWGFRLDSTPLFYLKNPGSALASVSAWQIIFVPVVIICIWTLLYKFLRINKKERYLGFSIVERGRDCFVFILFMGILFLPLRGDRKSVV